MATTDTPTCLDHPPRPRIEISLHHPHEPLIYDAFEDAMVDRTDFPPTVVDFAATYPSKESPSNVWVLFTRAYFPYPQDTERRIGSRSTRAREPTHDRSRQTSPHDLGCRSQCAYHLPLFYLPCRRLRAPRPSAVRTLARSPQHTFYIAHAVPTGE